MIGFVTKWHAVAPNLFLKRWISIMFRRRACFVFFCFFIFFKNGIWGFLGAKRKNRRRVRSAKNQENGFGRFSDASRHQIIWNSTHSTRMIFPRTFQTSRHPKTTQTKLKNWFSDFFGEKKIKTSQCAGLRPLKSNFGSFLRICFFYTKKPYFCLTSIEDISTTTWSWEKKLVPKMISSTRSFDLCTFHRSKIISKHHLTSSNIGKFQNWDFRKIMKNLDFWNS